MCKLHQIHIEEAYAHAGHFAALEKPELLMADMRAFFAMYH